MRRLLSTNELVEGSTDGINAMYILPVVTFSLNPVKLFHHYVLVSFQWREFLISFRVCDIMEQSTFFHSIVSSYIGRLYIDVLIRIHSLSS